MSSKQPLMNDDRIIAQPVIGQVIVMPLEKLTKISKYFIITDIIPEGVAVKSKKLERWFGSKMEDETWVENFKAPWPFDRLLLLSTSHPDYFIIPNSVSSIKDHFMLRIAAPHLRKLYE